MADVVPVDKGEIWPSSHAGGASRKLDRSRERPRAQARDAERGNSGNRPRKDVSHSTAIVPVAQCPFGATPRGLICTVSRPEVGKGSDPWACLRRSPCWLVGLIPSCPCPTAFSPLPPAILPPPGSHASCLPRLPLATVASPSRLPAWSQSANAAAARLTAAGPMQNGTLVGYSSPSRAPVSPASGGLISRQAASMVVREAGVAELADAPG